MKLAVFALAAVAVLAQDELSKEEQKALNQVAKQAQRETAALEKAKKKADNAQAKKDQKKNNADAKKQNKNKKDSHKNKKDKKRADAKQKKQEKVMEKTMDFECEGEPKTWPWFQNKGHWECQVGNKGKVCAYVCNYNVSKQTIVFCDNGEWMDSRFAHDKCL